MAWEITGNRGTDPNDPKNNFLGTIDNEPLVIRTNNTERLRVDANGNVGIGTGHPNKTLSVNGTIETSYEGIYFGGMFGVGGNDYNYGIGARESDSLVYDTFQYHRWRVGTNEKMTLDGSGNLGIGVNNPGMALDVRGRTRVRDGIGGPAAAVTAGIWFNTANAFGSDGIADIGFIGAVDPTRIGLYGNDPRGGSQWGFTFDTVTGNVGIGTGTDYPDAKLQVNGDILANGNVTVTGDVSLVNADCAEDFEIANADLVEPGTVMVLGEGGILEPSQNAYDKRVAGVVSGAGDYRPGIVLDKQGSQPNRKPIALLGKVYCKVDSQYGAVETGDLLTTSPTLGHAMKAIDHVKAFGAVIGKALCPLAKGQGLVPILIALQ